ncbi:substrate-binding periplasmic protein [Zooshikella harenae]|uniref:Transporter substrate-binding domain-containing protein n=1 Tax=Zooshikella harenae TaxID=2827238 RepID=A0ABS5ZEE1_9GAMM|nr:transporter substrate-binding domain-containing protein [Zooshikella harenae]MBU2712433.1 transporter substrate-binding domain-containing protein [Zooshikella harenae]
MKTGKGDGLFPMFITDDRIYFTAYSAKPLTYEYKSLFIHANHDIHFDGDLALLGQYHFCRVRGYSSGPVFDQAELNGTLPYVDLANSSLQNIQKILHSRCQILVDDKNVVAYLLKRLGQSDQLSLLVDLERIPSHMGFSKFGHASDLVKRFDEAHQAMIQDGTIDNILSHYLGKMIQQQ